jgi:hypothetical protein
MIEIIVNVPQLVWDYWPLLVTGASLLIKFLPELPENSKFKPIVRFIGKYVALNRSSTSGKVNIVINK